MIKNWLEIDGLNFNVVVTGITEEGTVLYSDKTGRTMAKGARMTLDPLGTFYGHKVTVKRKGNDVHSFDQLYNYVLTPVTNGFRIKAVHDQTTIEYDGYISSATRACKKIDERNGRVYWDSMELNIVAMEAQIIP